MALVQRKYAVGIFPNHQAVEQALNQLKEAGLSLDKVSVIAKNQNGERKDQLASADISNIIASKAGEVATVGAIAFLGGRKYTWLIRRFSCIKHSRSWPSDSSRCFSGKYAFR